MNRWFVVYMGVCEFCVLHGSILQLEQAIAREDLQEFEPQGAVRGGSSEVTVICRCLAAFLSFLLVVEFGDDPWKWRQK